MAFGFMLRTHANPAMLPQTAPWLTKPERRVPADKQRAEREVSHENHPSGSDSNILAPAKPADTIAESIEVMLVSGQPLLRTTPPITAELMFVTEAGLRRLYAQLFFRSPRANA